MKMEEEFTTRRAHELLSASVSLG